MKLFNFNIKDAFKENVIEPFKKDYKELSWAVKEEVKDIKQINYKEKIINIIPKIEFKKRYKPTHAKPNLFFSCCEFVFKKIKEAIKWLIQKLDSKSSKTSD